MKFFDKIFRNKKNLFIIFFVLFIFYIISITVGLNKIIEGYGYGRLHVDKCSDLIGEDAKSDCNRADQDTTNCVWRNNKCVLTSKYPCESYGSEGGCKRNNTKYCAWINNKCIDYGKCKNSRSQSHCNNVAKELGIPCKWYTDASQPYCDINY
jgi:hypothetical protein